MKNISLFESLMDVSIDAIFIAEVNTGTIIYANKAACKLLGYSSEELEGINQTKLHPSEDYEYMSNKFKEFVSDSSYKEIEARVIHKDGDIIPVKITSANLFFDNKILYAAAFFRDIRIQKEMQQIAYLQSHVVRRPLANILGLCSLIKEGVFANDEIVGAVDNILKEAEELDNVVREIVKRANS